MPDPQPPPRLVFHAAAQGNVVIHGDQSGQVSIGDGNKLIQIVQAPALASPASGPERQPWRFTLSENSEGTLKTLVHARLRIEPPQDGGRRMDFPVKVPIPTEAELRDLPWYCRVGARAKNEDQARAQKLEATLQGCGAAMMQAMLAEPEAFALWCQAVNGKVLWELEGSPAFHRIPWEWLLDEGRKLHPALNMHLRRRMTEVPGLQARAPQGGPLRILWVIARPGGKPARQVVLDPVRAALGDKAQITVVEDGSYKTLLQYLREHEKRPCFHLLHLDMHGSVATHARILAHQAVQPERWVLQHRNGGRRNLPTWEGTQGLLWFEETDSRYDPVTAQELATELNLNRMPLVVLNACESALATQDAEAEDGLALTAELVKAGGFAALGFAQALTVEGAALFFPAFYRSLAASPDAGHLDEAVRMGRLALHDTATRHGVALEDWHLPVCYAAREVGLP